ncbi:DUF5367 family protein [Bacillus swezeyi]|uniref:DUF5367 domain-containing protein n=1 Tax=Bacillus swezeyi TaxID=1925020 RepID=A0A1R1QQ05_9BACI|nr:DUF5367 family protein [Bacillus swezeyi]MEC1261920.1 DUF5367 family protein [Bacillus swezeyi]MED2930309.1 DUF5367 family protein [Bacillus swezeyi]MED2944476.1 DUF5367 family protein [Bacillus swezeyi]MED2966220.1 DUF5367 family protein [Bacillus swezeyi]MED2976789.1 DUF5367 family protein [Bacillus swezeyi]
MFTQKLGLTLLFSFLVWLGATMFFVLFGDSVLAEPGQHTFWIHFLLLETGTFVVLYTVLLFYQQLDKSPFAALKLGIWGSAVGLFLDTFSVWNHPLIFPAFSEGQVISFAIWMVCAYAMYLMIPLMLTRKKAA